jgi:hypothetical protein
MQRMCFLMVQLLVHKITIGPGAFNDCCLVPEVIASREASNFLAVQKYIFCVSCFGGKGNIFVGELFIFSVLNIVCSIESLV